MGRSTDGTAFDLHGPTEAPVVVLIHGLGLSRQLWAQHLPALTENYRVLNYDLYGHGESAPPAEPASLSVYASQLVGLLDELAVRQAAIIGFSIGGMINRRVALDNPDRVSSLIIVSSPHDRGLEQQDAVEQRAQAVRDSGPLATMDAALTRWFTPDYLVKHPGQAEQVKAWRLQADQESYSQAAWVLANGVRELINPSPTIRVPTLVITGENDSGSTPAMSHAIAAEIPEAETLIVPALQHLGLIEQPNLFMQPIVDFLANQELI